jgi:murein DD-endopeptidase MepM/ murein hydrolase activator NlpD
LATTPELESQGFTPEQIQENIVSEQETVRMSTLIGTYNSNVYFGDKFADPLDEMKNVGAYGNIRQSGNVSLQHLGVDLAAHIGTPVYAINEGIVRFVGSPVNYGKTLVVEHGLGIYSVYLHLDAFLVNEGDQVERKQIIAHAGNTGYSLAPHLHFSIRVNGVSVDPLLFLEAVNKFLD